MSAIAPKQTSATAPHMSAFEGKAVDFPSAHLIHTAHARVGRKDFKLAHDHQPLVIIVWLHALLNCIAHLMQRKDRKAR